MDQRREGGPIAMRELRISFSSRVRELRKQRGLTVRSLAGGAGVTSGFISQIENGQVMPSVTKLVALADALSVPVGALFDTVVPAHNILRSDQRPAREASPGLIDEVLSSDPTNQLEVFLRYQEPGAVDNELHVHDSGVEFALVLKGTVEIALKGQRLTLRSGDALTCSGEVPRSCVNVGKGRAEILWAVAPSGVESARASLAGSREAAGSIETPGGPPTQEEV